MRIEDLEGFISFPGGFQVLREQPIDARYLGRDKEFLQSIIDIGAAYPGLRVFIESENKTFIYKKGLDGLYSFDLESINFTDAEEAVLASGITKGKVEEFSKKYNKPSQGIPEKDLSEEVKAKLLKADNSIQEETDPTVPSWAKQPNKPSYSIKDIDGLEKELANKVNTEEGKGLTEQNYSYLEKEKLKNIEPKAEVNKISEILFSGSKLKVEGKTATVNFKKFNGKEIFGEEGNFEVVETSGDQTISGYKTFSKPIHIPGKEDINLENPSKTLVVTEAQVSKAIKSLGVVLTGDSKLDASKLQGSLPGVDQVSYPTFNQDTTGNSGSTNKLKTPIKVSLSGQAYSDPVSLDGSKDIALEVKGLSQNPLHYPTFNQDTTGNSGSTDKLKNPVSLKVKLEGTGETMFDGSYGVEIPVFGNLPFSKLAKGGGTGSRKRVLGTGISSNETELSLVTLNSSDVGLDKVVNEEQATKEEFNLLKTRVESLENMGSFIGAWDTHDDLPATSAEVSLKYGVIPTVNDFATVRGGNYPNSSGLKAGDVTCWSITKINSDGSLEWDFEYKYSVDLTGKIDLIKGDNLNGYLPVISSRGDLSRSDYKPADFILAKDKLPGTDITYKDKIQRAVDSEGVVQWAKKLKNETTGSGLNLGGEGIPVYFSEGVPVECSQVARKDERGYVVGKDGSNLKVIVSDLANKANLAEMANKFSVPIDDKGQPIAVGSQKVPVFINSEGKPTAIAGSLGRLAYLDLHQEDPEETRGVETGSLKVYYYKNKDVEEGNPEYHPEGAYYLQFTTELGTGGSESKETLFYLISKKGQNNEDVYGLKSWLGDNGIVVRSVIELESQTVGKVEKNGLTLREGWTEYSVSFDSGFGVKAKVEVFEIFGIIPPSGSFDSISLSEVLGMAKVSSTGSVTITSNCNSGDTSTLRGVYLVKVSK